MPDPETARATQLRNIEARTGHDLATLRAAVAASGKAKVGEVRAWLMETYALGYGDANGLALHAAAPAPANDPLDAIYAGGKAHLRAVHDALIAAIAPWGAFEIAPKKANVSLRRKKQFATIGPKNATHAELGINLKDDAASGRVFAHKPGGMCHYGALIATPAEIDDDLLAVLRRAFDAAG